MSRCPPQQAQNTGILSSYKIKAPKHSGLLCQAERLLGGWAFLCSHQVPGILSRTSFHQLVHRLAVTLHTGPVQGCLVEPGCARCTHSSSPQALGPCRELFASGIFLNIFEVFKSARFSRLSLELLNLSSWTESGQKIGPCHRSLVTVVGVGSWVSGVLIFSAHRSPRTPGPHCSEPALLRPAPQHHSLSPPPIPVSASPRPASFPACGHLASL